MGNILFENDSDKIEEQEDIEEIESINPNIRNNIVNSNRNNKWSS